MDIADHGPPGCEDEPDAAPSQAALEALIWGLPGAAYRLGLVAAGASGQLTKMHLHTDDHQTVTTWHLHPLIVLRHVGNHIFRYPLPAEIAPPPTADQVFELHWGGAHARLLWIARQPLGAIWNTEDPTKAPVGQPVLRTLREWLA
jgi:hypothetical protein